MEISLFNRVSTLSLKENILSWTLAVLLRENSFVFELWQGSKKKKISKYLHLVHKIPK